MHKPCAIALLLLSTLLLPVVVWGLGPGGRGMIYCTETLVDTTAAQIDCPAGATAGAKIVAKEATANGGHTISLVFPAAISANISTTAEDDTTYFDPQVSSNAYEMECFPFENLAAADDNVEFFMARSSVIVKEVGCYCNGTCTTPAQISLEDRAGNAMTHGTTTCSTGAGNTTFVAVTTGGELTGGEGLRFDVDNAVSPETDQYLICVAIRE